jgi:hypothetical protein
MTTPDLTCQVCGEEPAVGVVAMPGVPISFAYGRNCLSANAHPYDIVVANTADVDGYDNSADWWKQIVDDTLAHLGKTREQFDADVAEFAAEEAEYLKRLEAQQGPPCEHPDPPGKHETSLPGHFICNQCGASL